MTATQLVILYAVFGITFAIPAVRWVYNLLRLRVYPRVSRMHIWFEVIMFDTAVSSVNLASEDSFSSRRPALVTQSLDLNLARMFHLQVKAAYQAARNKLQESMAGKKKKKKKKAAAAV